MSKLNKLLSELFADVLFQDLSDIVVSHISTKFNIDRQKIEAVLDNKNSEIASSTNCCNCKNKETFSFTPKDINLSEEENSLDNLSPLQPRIFSDKVVERELPRSPSENYSSFKYMFDNEFISLDYECNESYPCFHKIHYKKENIKRFLNAEDIVDLFYSKGWDIPSHFNYITGDSETLPNDLYTFKEEEEKDEILYYLNIGRTENAILFRKTLDPLEGGSSIPITLKLMNHLEIGNNFSSYVPEYQINLSHGTKFNIVLKNTFTLEIILNSMSIAEEKIFNVPKRFTDKGEIDMTLILFNSLNKYLKNLENNLLFSKKNFLKYSNKSQYLPSLVN